MYWSFICFMLGVVVGLYAYRPFFVFMRRFFAYQYLFGKKATHKHFLDTFISTEPYAYKEFRRKVTTKPRNKQAYIKFLHKNKKTIEHTTTEFYKYRTKVFIPHIIGWLVIPIFITYKYYPYYLAGFTLVVAYNYFYSKYITKNTSLVDAMMEKMDIIAVTWERLHIKRNKKLQDNIDPYFDYKPTFMDIPIKEFIKKCTNAGPWWNKLLKIYYGTILVTCSILFAQLLMVIFINGIDTNVNFMFVFWATVAIFLGYTLFFWAITTIVIINYVLRNYRPQ